MRALFLLLLLFIAGCANTPLKHTRGVSILQVGSTDSSAEFNLLAPTGSEVEISVTGGAGVGVPQISRETVTHPQHPLSVHQFQVKGLPSPTDTYILVVKIDGREVDRRNFRLFSNRGEGMTFVVGSCSDHRYTENQSEVWNAVAAKKPEWLFLIGDNLYSVHKDTEVRSESQLWQAYVDSRQTLELYYLKDLIPTHAIWDDNDYGQKDGGSDYALKSASQEIFRTFFRPRFGMETMVTGPGVASRLNLCGTLPSWTIAASAKPQLTESTSAKNKKTGSSRTLKKRSSRPGSSPAISSSEATIHSNPMRAATRAPSRAF
ncbi:MAG: hypothetical protein ACLGG7_07855 [Bacteriovoracia bacterium]